MSKGAMNLQDSFLNQVRRENSEVRVLLVNGTVLRGSVKGFDNFTLILTNRQGQHLIYKHAIAQIVNQRPANHKTDEMHVSGFDGSDSHASISESNSASEVESEDHSSHPDNESSESPDVAEHLPVAVGVGSAPGPNSRGSRQPGRTREPRGPKENHSSDRKHHGGGSSSGATSGSGDSRGAQSQRQPKPRKEGFNTLDLSNVKLADDKESEQS